MVLSAIVTFYLESIRQAWEFVLESGAGIGLVLILRWYWWRVNAWSEIAAMVAAAAGYTALKLFTPLVFPYTLLAVVAWTTICWLIVTLLTAPEPEAHLVAFYRRDASDGPGWRHIAALAGGPPPAPLGGLLVDWLAGVILVYAILFGRWQRCSSATLSRRSPISPPRPLRLLVISRDLTRRGWQSVTG